MRTIIHRGRLDATGVLEWGSARNKQINRYINKQPNKTVGYDNNWRLGEKWFKGIHQKFE